MTPGLALRIGAVAAFGFGLALFAYPASMLANSGLVATSEATALARASGATLIGLGVIDWMARDAQGDTLRSLLAGNLVVQALSLFANLGSALTGQLPFQATAASLVHIALAAVFVLAMRSLPSSESR